MPFEEQLEEQLGDYIVVVISGVGEKYCRQEGILCSIMGDFIILIDGDERVEIPINQIGAVRKCAGGAVENY